MNEQAMVNAAYEASEEAYRQALVTNSCDELLATAEQSNTAEDWAVYEMAVAAARKTGDVAYEAVAQGRF